MPVNPDLQRQIESELHADDDPDERVRDTTLADIEEHLIEIKRGLWGLAVLMGIMFVVACYLFASAR